MSHDNRRKFTRILFKVDTRLEADGRYYSAVRTYNLSIGGCLLEINAPDGLSSGMDCDVKIVLSEKDDAFNIAVSGRIVRVGDEGMVAVQFTRIEPESLFHLRNVIRYNAPDVDAVEEEIEKHPGVI